MFDRYLVVAVGSADSLSPDFLGIIGTAWRKKKAERLAEKYGGEVVRFTPTVRASLEQFGSPFGQ